MLRFIRQFHNVLIYVLLGAAVSGVLQHWVDTGAILAVVLANAVIGFFQEGKAEAAMSAIRNMLAPKAAVLRDGKRVTLDRADIILPEAGDKLPADLRVLEARGLAPQEAILTGKTAPVEKGRKPVAVDSSLGDRQSMLWSGTLISRAGYHSPSCSARHFCWSTVTSSATCPLPTCSWRSSASPWPRSPKDCRQ